MVSMLDALYVDCQIVFPETRSKPMVNSFSKYLRSSSTCYLSDIPEPLFLSGGLGNASSLKHLLGKACQASSFQIGREGK